MTLRTLLLAAALAAPAAYAKGTALTLSYATTTARGGKRDVTMYLDGKKAAFDIHGEGANARNATLIRDGEGKRFITLNHAKQAYAVISDEQAKQFREGLEARKEALRAQLAQMPPAQRERMEEMLDRSGTHQGLAPKYTFKKKGTSRKIAGFTCDDYTVTEGKRVDGEGCFIPWKKAGISVKDLEGQLKQVSEGLGGGGRAGLSGMEADIGTSFPGLPAYRKRVDEQGNPLSETTLTKLDKGKVPAKVFEIPKGYTEQQIPTGPPPGGMPPGMMGPPGTRGQGPMGPGGAPPAAPPAPPKAPAPTK